MAANKQKQVVELDDRVRFNGDWDCHHDISTSIRNKSKTLQSRNDKVSFFTSLSEDFHINDPMADPDVVHFVGNLYDSVKPQLLQLLDGNEDVSTDGFDDNAGDGGGGGGGGDCGGDGVDVDENYSYFVNHLRLDGKSFVLDIPEEGIFVKYDGEELEGSTLPIATPSESNFDDWTRLISMDTEMNYQAERIRKPKEPLQSNVNPVEARRRGRKPKQSLALSIVVRSNMDFQVKKEEEDDDYLPDLKRSLIKRPEPVVNVDEWWHKSKARERRHTAFRDKLMDELKKPFSEEEYQRLLIRLAEKKPVQCQRVLRSCTKRYDDETRPPRSILDYHDDLAKIIDAARDDHPRVLSLLRGYFYWITNLSQEGSFLPWQDAACLEVVPQ